MSPDTIAAISVIAAVVASAGAIIGAVLNRRTGRETTGIARAASTVEAKAKEFVILDGTIDALVADGKRKDEALGRCLRNEQKWVEWARTHFPEFPPPDLEVV